jgi:hypothetical protein
MKEDYGWIWTFDVWFDVGMIITVGEGDVCWDINDDRRELTLLLLLLLFAVLADRIGCGYENI